MVNGISEKRRFVERASESRLVEMLIAFYVQPASAENQEFWHFRQKVFRTSPQGVDFNATSIIKGSGRTCIVWRQTSPSTGPSQPV